MPIVVIDPGHGGTAPAGNPPSSPNNAQGPRGTLKKNLTLDIARRCRSMLQQLGVDVRMTRDEDQNLGLYERANVARLAQADAFVSIHLNGDSNPTIQGTETWVYTATPTTASSYRLARLVQAQLVAATGHSDRGVRLGGLGNLNPEQHYFGTAACLAELSFLTDPDEEARLLTVTYKNTLAHALALGIQDYVSRRFVLLDQPLADAVTLGDGEEEPGGESVEVLDVTADLRAQIANGRITFDPPTATAERLRRELLRENDGRVRVTEKLLRLVLALSRTIDDGRFLRISSSIRDEGHHGDGRAVDIGNEDIADHRLRVNRVATDATVADLEIDELIHDAGGGTPALRNRWNYDLGVRHNYDDATLQQHQNHIHFAVQV